MATTIVINETGPLKRDIIEMAFEECGSAGFEFERDPDEVVAALRRLNTMMREWPWNRLGYVQPDYGAGAPEERSGIPDAALGAVAGYLALKIAPMLGATLSTETKTALSKSYLLVLAAVSKPPRLHMGMTPRGAGARGSLYIREGLVDVPDADPGNLAGIVGGLE